VIAGMVFYQEYVQMSDTQRGLFSLGVIMTIIGVILLSFRPIDTTHIISPPRSTRSKKKNTQDTIPLLDENVIQMSQS
jgi:hypothetical protein